MVSTIEQAAESRTLRRAAEKVEDSWFPANPELVSRISRGLESGAYDLDIEFLIEELKTDFSLFTYCIKELTSLLQKSRHSVTIPKNPIDLIRIAGADLIRPIITNAKDQLADHGFDQWSDLHARRVTESMVSASTVEVLAERGSLDPELSYSGSLFRQLGLTLIAWNYQTVYKRTLANLKSEQSLDTALEKVLGFSPKLLGLVMAREWGLAPELRSAMGDGSASEVLDPEHATRVEATAEQLAKLCEVGEALARANNPEDYPQSNSNWDAARAAVEETLGENGIKEIKKRVLKYCENYIEAAPSIFEGASEFNPEARLHKAQKNDLFEANRYAKHCDPNTKALLRTFYSKLSSKEIDRDAIAMLVKEIVPRAGFTRGAIYLLNPETVSLTPRLAIGSGKLADFPAVDCSATAFSSDPILAAYRCKTPIIENSLTADRGEVTHITGVLGATQKSGVLYLEVGEGLLTDPERQPLLVYKALHQALQDCLKLN